MPSLSVILPQHGESRLTLTAVHSLLEHHEAGLEVLIVDDGSSAADRRVLQRELPSSVSILPLRSRMGVTAAWNAGAAAARGDVLVFLNNDTVTAGPWLPELTAPLKDSQRLLTGCEWRTERDLPAMAERFLAGWCLALTRETFQALNGFDERLRLYYSDTDLQLRLMLANGRLQGVDHLPLRHLGQRSTRHLADRSTQWREDRGRFLRKWAQLTPGKGT